VLVRIEAAGICHSDLSVVNRSRPRKRAWISPLALVDGAKLLTARIELDDINYALDELEAGRAIRQLMEFPS
jgi:Zn-dependent alcohol dehydrogenase